MSRKVLVVYATKTGSTAGIAQAIGCGLRECGHQVDVRECREVDSIDEYDAVVLGSAIYAGRWRREAVTFLRKHIDELRDRQVWLFHSGPLGAQSDRLEPMPKKVRRLAQRIGAIPAMTFAGALQLETAKGFLALRMVLTELAGDFRDWDLIAAWADDVGAAISSAEAGAWHRPAAYRAEAS